jgi:hypothetical protein
VTITIPTHRFVVALADGPLEPNPTWTNVGEYGSVNRIQSWKVDVGRNSEFDKTDIGTASVTIVDSDGTFDLTNPFSTLAPDLAPGLQAAILLHDPVANAWHWRFRGFIDEILVTLDPTAQYSVVTFELVDWFSRLAEWEMMPGLIGDAVPTGSEGDIYFAETSGMREVAGRIDDILTTVGVDTDLQRIFTGNVQAQAGTYARRDTVLSVLMDCADAEFPGVANLFCAKDGNITFHGRLARFDPSTYSAANDLARSGGNSICFWSAGSATVADVDATVVPIRGQLSYRLSSQDIRNEVLALPMFVDDTDVPTQLASDSTSIDAYGRHSETYTNLLTLSGVGPTTAVEETKKFADYYVDNYSTPRVRITQMTFIVEPSAGFSAAASWAFAAGVDIGDVITVTTHHFANADEPDGQGGFAADYFVEKLSITAEPGQNGGEIVTIEADVSPRAFYDTDPWA